MNYIDLHTINAKNPVSKSEVLTQPFIKKLINKSSVLLVKCIFFYYTEIMKSLHTNGS